MLSVGVLPSWVSAQSVGGWCVDIVYFYTSICLHWLKPRYMILLPLIDNKYSSKYCYENAFILMWLFISSLRSFWDFTCSNSTRATPSYFYSINAACALVSQEPLEVGIHAVSDYETIRSPRNLGIGVHALPIWATPVSMRCLRGVSHMQPHLYVFLLWCTFWEQGWRPWLRVAVVASCTVFVHTSLYLSIFHCTGRLTQHHPAIADKQYNLGTLISDN